MSKYTWCTSKIKDLPISIIDGDRSTRYPKREEFVSEGVVFLNTTNFVEDALDLSQVNFVSEEKYSEIKKGRVAYLDTVITTRGTVGKSILYKRSGPALINAQMLILRADDQTVDKKFLNFLIRSPHLQELFRGFASGSAQPQLPIQDLREIAISLPPLPTQRKIAAVLSAYDDLIENNTRRIQILEEMARALYREWFVEFRFPGHENVPMVATEGGRVPEGWSVRLLGDLATTNVRSVKKGQEPDPLLYVDIASVTAGDIQSLREYTWADAPGRARRLVKDGDIIWSCVRPNRRSYGLVLAPPTNMVVSTGFAVISAKAIPFTFLYHTVTTDDFVGYLTNTATGAAYPAVTAKDFEAAEIVVPKDDLAEAFHEHAGQSIARLGYSRHGITICAIPATCSYRS